MTIIGVTNWKLNVQELYENLQPVPYQIEKKKRGRRKNIPKVNVNSGVPIGSIISIINGPHIKGIRLKPKKASAKKKKEGDLEFRNSITVIMKLAQNKLVNAKLSNNGKIQMTGCKKINHAVLFVDFMWKYIQDISQKTKNRAVEEGIVPSCILNIVMTNVTYKIDFKLNRQRLDGFINSNVVRDVISNFEPSFTYSGVNIKKRSYIDTDSRMKKITWNNEKKYTISDCKFRDYLDMLSKHDQIKEKSRVKFNTWLVFQSGSIIQSGPSFEEMMKLKQKLLEILNKNRFLIEEVLGSEKHDQILTDNRWVHYCHDKSTELNIEDGCERCGKKIFIYHI